MRLEDEKNIEQLRRKALVLAQEYMFTDFDWRIGVLNREAIYACKYFMSRGHWQIYDHAHGGAKGVPRSGGFKTLPDARDFMGRQIVNDDDATLFHLGDEALFEPLLEDHSSHWARQKLRG